MRLEGNELDRLFGVNLVLGVLMIGVGLFADVIAARLQLSLAPGIGLLQAAWVMLWGVYTWWVWEYMTYYGK